MRRSFYFYKLYKSLAMIIVWQEFFCALAMETCTCTYENMLNFLVIGRSVLRDGRRYKFSKNLRRVYNA